MKLAYLVFAYHNPGLLKKVIRRLSCADASFYVHIDAKRDIQPFHSLGGTNVQFTARRIAVQWAEFSGVEAILLLMREALSGRSRYDYFVLLSGSDYPIRSTPYIHEFFSKNNGREFITMAKMPAPGKPFSRINTIRFPSSRPIARLTFRALAKFGLATRDYRKYFGTLEPYSGITWWALTRDACEYIVDFTERDQRLAKFFRHAFAPEETFIHTILGNSVFRSQIRRNIMYEDWSSRGSHPEMLNDGHLELFERQQQVTINDLHGPGELLFARKFSDDSLHLLQRVDAMIRRKDNDD